MFLFSLFSKEKKTSKAPLKRRKQRTTKHRLSHPFHKKVFHLEYWMDRATGFATAPDLLGMASPLTPDNLSIIDLSESDHDVAMVESPKDSQPSSKLFSENVAPTPETRPSPVMSDSANLPDGKSEEARRLIQDLLTLPASQLPSLFPLPGLKPPTKDTEWESLLSIDVTESRSILAPNDENEPVNVPIGAKQFDQDKLVSAANGANKPTSVPVDENKQVNVPADNKPISVEIPNGHNKPVSAANGANKPASVPIDDSKQFNVPIDSKSISLDVPNDQVSASIDAKPISVHVPIDQNEQVIVEETNPPPVAKLIQVNPQAKDIKPPSVNIPDVTVPNSKPVHKRKRKTPKDPRQFMLDAIAASREYDKKHYENKVGHRTKPVVSMPGLSQACAKELQGLLGGHVEVAVPKEVQKVERAPEAKKVEQVPEIKKVERAHGDKKNEQVPEVKKHTLEAKMVEPTPKAKMVEPTPKAKKVEQAPVAKKVESTPDVDPPKINSPLKDISSIDADKLPSDIPPPTPPYSLPDTPTESDSVREYNRSFSLTDRLNLDRFRKLRPFIRRPAFATRQYRTKSDISKLLIIDDILVGVRSSNLKTVTIIPNGPLYADPSLPPLSNIRPTDDDPVDRYNCEPKEKPVKKSAKNLIKERGNSKTKASKVDRSTHLKNISGNDNCHEYHDRRDPSGQRLRTLALLRNANKSCGDFSMGFEGNDKVYSKTCQKVRFADTVECHEIDQEAVVRPLREGEDPWLVYGEERRKRRRFEYQFKPISALKVKLSPFWKTDIKVLAYTKNVTFKQFERDVKRRIKEFKKGRWKADRMVQLHLYERSNEHVRWEE